MFGQAVVNFKHQNIANMKTRPFFVNRRFEVSAVIGFVTAVSSSHAPNYLSDVVNGKLLLI